MMIAYLLVRVSFAKLQDKINFQKLLQNDVSKQVLNFNWVVGVHIGVPYHLKFQQPIRINNLSFWESFLVPRQYSREIVGPYSIVPCMMHGFIKI